jgi:hypothetical protein
MPRRLTECSTPRGECRDSHDKVGWITPRRLRMLLRFGRTIRENMSAIAGAAREIQLCGPSSGENDDTTRSASIYEHGAWKNGRFPRSIYGLASNRHCGPMQLGEPPCTDTQAWCGFRDELKGKASPFYSIGPCRPPIRAYPNRSSSA